MLKIRESVLKDLKARSQSRAIALCAMANKFRSLEAAIRSRNNEDFRDAVVEVVNASKTPEIARARLDVIQAENLSAFLQFADGLFEGVSARASGGPVASASLIDRLGLEDDASNI